VLDVGRDVSTGEVDEIEPVEHDRQATPAETDRPDLGESTEVVFTQGPFEAIQRNPAAPTPISRRRHLTRSFGDADS